MAIRSKRAIFVSLFIGLGTFNSKSSLAIVGVGKDLEFA